MLTTDERRVLAELCGLELQSRFEDHSISVYAKPGQEKHNYVCTEDNWEPDDNIEQAYMVEDKINEGRQGDYMHHLAIACGAYYDEECYEWDAFKLVHATAEQRCRAALALKGEGI